MRPGRIILPLVLTLTLASGGAASLATVSTVDDNETSIVQYGPSHHSSTTQTDTALFLAFAVGGTIILFGRARTKYFADHRATPRIASLSRAPPCRS